MSLTSLTSCWHLFLKKLLNSVFICSGSVLACSSLNTCRSKGCECWWTGLCLARGTDGRGRDEFVPATYVIKPVSFSKRTGSSEQSQTTPLLAAVNASRPQELSVIATSTQGHHRTVSVSTSSQRPSSLAVLQVQGDSTKTATHNTILLVVLAGVQGFPSSDTFPTLSGAKEQEPWRTDNVHCPNLNNSMISAADSKSPNSTVGKSAKFPQTMWRIYPREVENQGSICDSPMRPTAHNSVKMTLTWTWHSHLWACFSPSFVLCKEIRDRFSAVHLLLLSILPQQRRDFTENLFSCK